MSPNRQPVAVVVGATSKWQADGRNTKLAHGKALDDRDLPVGVRWGVGGAIAQKFAREGFVVVLTTRHATNAEALQQAIRAEGGTGLIVELDLVSEASITKAFATIREQVGDPEVLVYNAGYLEGRDLPPDKELLEHVPLEILETAQHIASRGPLLVDARAPADAVLDQAELLARPGRLGYSRRTGMRDQKIFYGWWVVGAFSVTTFMSTGVRHAVGPFLKPIVADLNLDRASFSAVIALSLFLYGVFMPLAGMALDRFSVRVVASAGTLLLVASLILTAMVRNVWEFAAVYGVLVPLGLTGTGPVIASGVVARWFSRRRGTALSVLGSASMTGMSLLVPAVTWLVLTTGWRTTYVVIAIMILAISLPLCIWVLRDSPESVGLTADGEPHLTGAPRSEE